MSIKKREKRYIYERDNKTCVFCSKRLKYHQISLDHYMPLSKGGFDEIFNIVTSCKKCNKIKKDILPNNYKEIILELFLKAVKDNIIIGENLNISNSELRDELLEVNKLEKITSDYIVFQSATKRFHVKHSKIIKRIFIS